MRRIKEGWVWITATKRRKRAALSVAILAFTGIVAAVWIGNSSSKAEPAAVLRKDYFERLVEADGMIESAQKAEVHAPSGLRVREILVSEGDPILEGGLLALLDTEALELEIKRAELNIRSAEANMSSEQTAQANSVTSARNALSSAEVSLQAARREYQALLDKQGKETAVAVAGINLEAAERGYAYNLSLFEIGGISREMLTQSENTLDKAQTAYNDAVRGAKESLDRAKESLDAALVRRKTAEDALSDAVAKNTDPAAIALELQRVAHSEKLLRLRDASIRSPIKGIVTLVSAKEGAPASGLMFVVEDEQDLLVRARVAETDIPLITEGALCRIRPAGGEQILTGVVTRLPFAAEREITGAFSAVVGDDAYYIVEVALDSAQPGVLIGMNAKVSIVAGTRESCFAVLNGLVYRDGERSWVIARGWDGRLTEVPVQTGLATRRMTEIISDDLYEGMELFNRVD